MIRDHLFAMRAKSHSGLLWTLYTARIETVLTKKRTTSSRKANPVIFNSPLLKDAKEFDFCAHAKIMKYDFTIKVPRNHVNNYAAILPMSL